MTTTMFGGIRLLPRWFGAVDTGLGRPVDGFMPGPIIEQYILQ